MITRRDLEQYRDDKKNAKDLALRIEELESRMYGLSAVRYTGMPSAPNPTGEPSQIRAVDESGEEKDKLVRQYTGAKTVLDNKCAVIESALLKLPSRLQMILREFYIDGKTLRKIAEAHHYSVEQIKRLKRRGIKMITTLKDDPS